MSFRQLDYKTLLVEPAQGAHYFDFRSIKGVMSVINLLEREFVSSMMIPCGRCENPLCSNLVEPASTGGGNHWRRTPRKFCSDQCKSDAWAIRRVRALLEPLPADKQHEILFGQDQTSRLNQHEINEEITAPKTYRCTEWPKLRIGKMISFRDGLFTTAGRQEEDGKVQKTK